MRINLFFLRKKYNLTQEKAANILDVCRYTINKAEKNGYILEMNATKYYNLSLKQPNYIKLPVDFFYYTKPIVTMNAYLQGISKEKIKNLYIFRQNQISNHEDMFLYDRKENIQKMFSSYYVPYLYDSKKMVEQDPEAYEKDIQDILTKQVLKDVPVGPEEKYNAFNIKCNLGYYNMSQAKFAKLLNINEMKITRMLQNNTNFSEYACIIENIFPNYIYGKKEEYPLLEEEL